MRVHIPGGYYHVTLRGNHRQDIFRDPADRSALDAIVRGACEGTGAQVLAYCWMTNHLHLVVRVAVEPLGRVMQIVGSRYARYLQHRCGTTGHLFERRYHAVLVARLDQLLHVVRYVHLNPVRAGLVPAPGDYPWSSHRCYLGLVEVPWVLAGVVLLQLASDLPEARRAFAVFCGEALDSPGCMDADRAILAAASGPGHADAARHQPRPGRSLDEIVAALCCRAGIPEERLAAPGKSHYLSALRAEIAVIACLEGAATLTDVARRFNRDLSSVARAAARWRATQGNGSCQMPNPVPLERFT